VTDLRILIFTFILAAVGTLPVLTFSKPADAKKTMKPCLFCHTKYGSKELTKAGKYYKDKGTLEGFEEAVGEKSFVKRQEVPWVSLPYKAADGANQAADTADLRNRIAQKGWLEAKDRTLKSNDPSDRGTPPI